MATKSSTPKNASKTVVKSAGSGAQPNLGSVSLDDKYDLTKDSVFITGTQAVVRLSLMQKERDRRAGLNTAGYVSGYRGSPIGGLDLAMWKATTLLQRNDVVFEPGLNEDLAATAIWGSQQAEMRGEGKFDGVCGIWYGKGPGVDRSGDVFRHANLAGTSKHGGVLLLMGDDHTAESSTTAHQSEFHLLDLKIPILSPAGVQEILDYGVFGYGLSRYAGVWVGIKCVKDTIESTAVVDGTVDRMTLVEPEVDKRPPGGLNIRPSDPILAQEERLHVHKRYAIQDYVEANGINQTIISGGPKAKVGIITAGKSYLDVRQAMDDLGIDEVKAANLGMRLYKCGCVWPLSQRELRRFAEGLDLIIVVEEKRALVEIQVVEELYGIKKPPVVVGKKDEKGEWLFPIHGALDSNQIAIAIGERLNKFAKDKALGAAVKRLKDAQETLKLTQGVAQRIPYFCAGCPHNSSTHVPEGSRAYAGIGCHYMAQWMDRETEGYTQMGGEGVNWVGERHFSTRDHVFQNLGDGTYNHSGSLAIRHAVDTKTNITYKILFNDAVAMTGGQPNEGSLTPWAIAQQVAGEGVERVVVVTDEPEKYSSDTPWPAFTKVEHRSQLNAVQQELRQIKGVTVMIYDQTCAAEKRRRRKRGTFPDPDRRIVINEQVCEGCGDCGVKSNCVAVGAVETEFGRKRQIDQSSCNKDFSCAEGFCPSFVTVHGGVMKKGKKAVAGNDFPKIPEPSLPLLDGSYGVIATGVGGTGVVTVGAVIGMAAHLEGKGTAIIDMAGLAQKGGEVASHLRIAPSPDDIKSIRIAASGADLILGCDMVTASTQKVLGSIEKGRTRVVLNTDERLSGEFTHNVDFSFPTQRIIKTMETLAGADRTAVVEAEHYGRELMGDAIAANMFMLGFAWQNGGLPVTEEAIMRAIELNGVAIPMNQAAFQWGRVAAHDMSLLPKATVEESELLDHRRLSDDLDEMVQRRADRLVDYQHAGCAQRFMNGVDRIRAAEGKLGSNTRLTEAVARYLYKLMAIKDEYEVARLFSNGAFEAQLKSQFDSWDKLEFHLAPPLFSKRNDKGELIKRKYGPWMMKAYGWLARLRVLRHTAFDPFGYTAERRMERRLLTDYEELIGEIAGSLNADNHEAAIALASYPETIRGYGHVKERNVEKSENERDRLLAAFRNPQRAEALEAAE
ncbi:MAG: indolepyruvate ferredoxin oxidoreductase family protein [Ahrensia sp.]|nr:indolepyruvate ferredoxin oxidoreductase family protein [Ahrensia sp.]